MQVSLGNSAQPTSQIDANSLAGGSRRVEEVHQDIPGGSNKISFLSELPGSTHDEILALNVQQAGGDFPEVHTNGVPVLLQEQDFAVNVHGQHGHRPRVVDVIPDQG